MVFEKLQLAELLNPEEGFAANTYDKVELNNSITITNDTTTIIENFSGSFIIYTIVIYYFFPTVNR